MYVNLSKNYLDMKELATKKGLIYLESKRYLINKDIIGQNNFGKSFLAPFKHFYSNGNLHCFIMVNGQFRCIQMKVSKMSDRNTSSIFGHRMASSPLTVLNPCEMSSAPHYEWR